MYIFKPFQTGLLFDISLRKESQLCNNLFKVITSVEIFKHYKKELYVYFMILLFAICFNLLTVVITENKLKATC